MTPSYRVLHKKQSLALALYETIANGAVIVTEKEFLLWLIHLLYIFQLAM